MWTVTLGPTAFKGPRRRIREDGDVSGSVEPETSSGAGRPRSTSRRALEIVALRLFAEHGFDETTVDEIASEAGVSRRTFFRYFPSKNAVLMGEFDEEIETIRRLLAAADPATPMMDAVREAVVTANHYRAEDVPELRSRMNLLGTVPALHAASSVQYAAWERVVSEFVGARLGQPANSLYPLAVGRATLAVCRSAYDRWAERADEDLQRYLDVALRALALGFDEGKLPPPALP
jgi:mycofactocin system transcriptional regulator